MSQPMNGVAHSELTGEHGHPLQWVVPGLPPDAAFPSEVFPETSGESGLDQPVSREGSILLTLALEEARLGTWNLDLSSGALAGSDRYNRIFARTPADPLRHWDDWRACVHPDDRERLDRALETAIVRNQTTFDAEYRITVPHGQVRRVASSAQLLRGPRGAATRLIGIAHLVEATAPPDERLRASEKERESLEIQLHRKDEFLALLSHELRWPLAPIRNALKILQTLAVADAKFAWARDLIERQVLQMSRLVDDLLDLSRIAHGKTHLKRESAEIARIVAHAVETVQPLLELRGQRLSVCLPTKPLQLYGDSLRLAQVFTNLLNNASKYSDVGAIIAVRVEQGAGEVIFRVKDTGVGIPSEHLPHIFDVFFQGDPSHVGAQSGLGVGLSLVAQFVKMHDGKVAAFSDGPGRGSEFIVRLPLAQPPFAEA